MQASEPPGPPVLQRPAAAMVQHPCHGAILHLPAPLGDGLHGLLQTSILHKGDNSPLHALHLEASRTHLEILHCANLLLQPLRQVCRLQSWWQVSNEDTFIWAACKVTNSWVPFRFRPAPGLHCCRTSCREVSCRRGWLPRHCSRCTTSGPAQNYEE